MKAQAEALDHQGIPHISFFSKEAAVSEREGKRQQKKNGGKSLKCSAQVLPSGCCFKDFHEQTLALPT